MNSKVKMGAPSKPGFRLDRTFFGYEREDRAKLHDSLFELVWAGEGRWNWDTVYNMPIWMRNFWIRKLKKMAEIKKLEIERKSKKSSPNSKIQKPPM